MESTSLNFTIPLNYSNLWMFIPQDEDIAYSAFYKVRFEEGYVHPFKSNKLWDSHVIFTNKGLYHGEYRWRKQPAIQFVPWREVRKLRRRSIALRRPLYDLIIRREPNFESRDESKKRKGETRNILQPLMKGDMAPSLTGHFKSTSAILKRCALKRFDEPQSEALKTASSVECEDKIQKGFKLMDIESDAREQTKLGITKNYEDLRKKKMTNQLPSFLLDLFCITCAIMIFIIGTLIATSSLSVDVFSSGASISLIVLILAILHRILVKKRRFALKAIGELTKDGKAITGNYFADLVPKFTKSNKGMREERLIATEACHADEYQYLFKTAVIGDRGVGKATLMRHFRGSFFSEDYGMTLGVEFYIQTITINTTEGPISCRLQLWNVVDGERFRILRRMYYRGSLGAMLIFDLTNSESFAHVPRWIDEIRPNVGANMPILLIGNKADLVNQRAVSKEEIDEIRRNFNLEYLETSATTGDGVEDCFYTFTRLIMEELESY